ncbi:MAG TPA: hypothetical protein VEL47_02825, partial [Myxococcota bacterium]|nr:hypothetical protein [Myxococcota bacterium]
AVKLYVENRDGVQTKFIIKIEPVSDEFVISAKMYAALAKAKVSAVVNGKLLSLNLSAIDREEVDPQYCISLVDDPDKEEAKKVNKELSTIEDEATDYLIERDSAKHHRALHLKKHHRPIE